MSAVVGVVGVVGGLGMLISLAGGYLIGVDLRFMSAGVIGCT